MYLADIEQNLSYHLCLYIKNPDLFVGESVLYCFSDLSLMLTRTRTQQMAAEGKGLVPLKKFTSYNDVHVVPAVWLNKYAIFAISKGWNPQQTLNNVGLY